MLAIDSGRGMTDFAHSSLDGVTSGSSPGTGLGAIGRLAKTDTIDAAVREYSPEKATIILMRPQTGEILAMANRPNFDLNERSEAKPEQMKNRALRFYLVLGLGDFLFGVGEGIA